MSVHSRFTVVVALGAALVATPSLGAPAKTPAEHAAPKHGPPPKYAPPTAKPKEPLPAPAPVRVTAPDEPGVPLRLVIGVMDALGHAIPNAEVDVYQTDQDGYYDRGPDGRERGPGNPRLHATGRTGVNGAVTFETIVPGSYPSSGIFRHIHYRLSAAGYEAKQKEIMLDEPPRPTDEQKRHAEENGDTVARRVKGLDGRFEVRVTLQLQPSKEK